MNVWIPHERVTVSLFPCHETITVLAEILAAGGRSRRLGILQKVLISEGIVLSALRVYPGDLSSS